MICEAVVMENKITIDRKSKLPLYAQIKEQIVDLVREKKLLFRFCQGKLKMIINN